MMKPKTYHYRWEWRLRSRPEQLWPYIADTNRFDFDAGLPPVQRIAVKSPGLWPKLRAVSLGMVLEWEEKPFEWVYPRRFGVSRRYVKGPLTDLEAVVELLEDHEPGTTLVYQLWIRTESVLGRLAIPCQIRYKTYRAFTSVFRHYDDQAFRGVPPGLSSDASVRLTPGARERLDRLSALLIQDGEKAGLVEKLRHALMHQDSISLSRIRPYRWADQWEVPRREVLEFCLKATRTGLLEMRWDLLCPMCRGAGQSAGRLKDVHSRVHCAGCRIDFRVNFDRFAEVTFRPNPSVRTVETRTFCIGGPQLKPHIAVQQPVGPGECRRIRPHLEHGRYRLRSLEESGAQFIRIAANGAASASLGPGSDGWPSDELQLRSPAVIDLTNSTSRLQTLILERMAWADDAATAAEVIALQKFRDLFSEEILRPGEEISVGSLCIAFTDLKNSTRLYREIGDARAFGLVMNHFDVLKACIATEGGSIVKTIGDAVMAVFRRPLCAIRALLEAQRILASTAADPSQALNLKAGVHYGSCIAVTLNERLDYFGTAVNLASRLEKLSAGQDIIVSDAVLEDPEVTNLLSSHGPSPAMKAEAMDAHVKGFESESLKLWRLKV